jgi:hypothetical protein
LLGALACTLLVRTVEAGPILTPLSSFGGGDGWLAPGERAYLTTDNTQRGLAYNPVTGNLLLVNRAGGLSVNVINAATGADAGTLALSSSMTGTGNGIFPLNMIAAANDGVIYAANLADTSSAEFRVYTWANESAVPTGDYRGQPGTSQPRLGDTLDVRGVGPDTELLIGTGNGTFSSAANKGYMLIRTSGGAPYSASPRDFSTTPPQADDHRLGITFMQGDTVIGTRGGLANFTDLQPARVSTFADDGVATLQASPVLTARGERPMDFAVIGGVPVLATVDTDTSIVRIYDMSNQNSPVLLDQHTNISGASNANGNGVGQVRFGSIVNDTTTLYALNTNNGIQAFSVFIPEPASAATCMMWLIPAIALRRRR